MAAKNVATREGSHVNLFSPPNCWISLKTNNFFGFAKRDFWNFIVLTVRRSLPKYRFRNATAFDETDKT